MKVTSAFLSFICGLALLIFLLISSFGMAAFYDIDYFGYEFEKNSIDKVTGYSIEKLENEMKERLHSVLGLRAKLRLAEPKSIERTTGKAKRIIDLREQD